MDGTYFRLSCKGSKPAEKDACGRVAGRLAPSPTGLLHIGNAWSFLCAWLGARKAGGSLVMRIEDIDPQRSRPELIEAICEDLRWLGLDWDEGHDKGGARGPYLQSQRLESYAAALEELEKRGFLYPCFCTRKELRSLAGAPQAGDLTDGIYSGACRTLSDDERAGRKACGRANSLRIRFEENLRPEFLFIDDLVCGPTVFSREQAGGDFAVCRSDGVIAYQLAVVLDDIAMGVTQVVRGADIQSSTPRQLFLYSLFGGTPPDYAHVPLLLDHEGNRLAKRHASISLRGLRAAGVRPEAVLGWLAHWGGLAARNESISARELLVDFDFAAVGRTVARLPANIAEVMRSRPFNF